MIMPHPSNSRQERPSAEDQRLEAEEMRQEAQWVASEGTISKRTMAIAFGLVFLLVPLLTAPAVGEWRIALLSLLGLLLILWGVLQKKAPTARA